MTIRLGDGSERRDEYTLVHLFHSETDAFVVLDSSGFLYAPDPTNAEGYNLNPNEARTLAEALLSWAERREAELAGRK